MAQLTENNARKYEPIGTDVNVLPLDAAAIVYAGSALSQVGGNVHQLVAGEDFVGFALEKVDNSGGGAGDKDVELRDIGTVELPIAGVTVADINAKVYASDGDTFTLTATANSEIGYVKQVRTPGLAQVRFAPVPA